MWEALASKYGLDPNRYGEFEYLTYFPIGDVYVENYAKFHLGTEEPIIKGRIRSHYNFWSTLTTIPWLRDLIQNGVKIPFKHVPPKIVLPNNKSAVASDMVLWVRNTLHEYLRYGFVEKVKEIPYCVMPLQVKATGDKTALIYDMSVLNEYVEKNKFKLEGWEEMFNYSVSANFAIKFDLKKFYHEIDINEQHKKYFGFMCQMEDNQPHTYFVWATVPYGYTRAPYIAKSLMKPLVTKWRKLGCKIVVFYDDGMAVGNDYNLLKKQGLQIQCDLLRAGLVPGVTKCIWEPVSVVQWNGLKFDFEKKGIAVMDHRVEHMLAKIEYLIKNWPKVTYRDISQLLGQINSMHPVLEGKATLCSKNLQTFVNIRHFKEMSWDTLINSDFVELYTKAKQEIEFWKDNILLLNFRNFTDPEPSCVGWVDASDHAIGGILVKLVPGSERKRPVTMDNWVLDGAGVLPIARNCAKLQVDSFPTGPRIVTDHDLDPNVVDKLFTVHRNLNYAEKAMDSNERELLAAIELFTGCAEYLRNSFFTLHFDNMNAASILEKGSSKFRLQNYATFTERICRNYNVKLKTVWIPRCLNNAADLLSKMVDYEDYTVQKWFFELATQISGFVPNFDRFANNWNTMCANFNSLTYCVGTKGVDAFAYSWGGNSKNWLFPPPRLIMQAVLHLEKSFGQALLLVPQWKNSAFYPFLMEFLKSKYLKNRWVLNGRNVFQRGMDNSSCFGPDFSGQVELWLFDFNL
jgi:hypothetical protein